MASLPVKNFSFFILFLFVLTGLFAQEKSTSPAGNDVVEPVAKKNPAVTAKDSKTAPKPVSEKVPAAAKKKPVEKAAKKKPPAARRAEKKDEAKPMAPAGSSADGTLLPIKEGNFKYSRIPEIVLKEKDAEKPDDFVTISAEKFEETGKPVEKAEKGFLGLDKKTADWVARIGLALLIVIIFLLYRFRSRGSRSVHRSYLK